MSNVYDILYRKPALEKEDMFLELESLAEALVQSGLFRVDAEDKVNFVRLSRPYERVEMIFSHRELYDPNILPRTQQRLGHAFRRYYSGTALDRMVEDEINRLHLLLGKYSVVPHELEMKLARAITQAVHPVVLMLVLLEGVEVFVSYSHTVGDMLDMQSWQLVGSSSGLQSTGGGQSAIFVSCGGDPFVSEAEPNKQPWDGFSALARMIVIAGQEFGHFADIMRDSHGRIVSRHSADLGGRRAKDHVRFGRLKDIQEVDRIAAKLNKMGLRELTEVEREIKFFEVNRNEPGLIRRRKRKRNRMKRRFVHKCISAGMYWVTTITQDGNLGTQITMCLADMRFNLAPKADAYSRDDPVEEEAIACIEALARVPQQVNKWGHKATRVLMPYLYKVYFTEVIPACIKSYQVISGRRYSRFKFTRLELPLWRRIQRWWSKRQKIKKEQKRIKKREKEREK